jgi:hypothetical protein
MILYLTIAIVILILTIGDTANSLPQNLKNAALTALFLFLAMFAGLRQDVGVDYKSYYQIFSRNSDSINEPIFRFMCEFVRSEHISPALVICILAVITIFFVRKFITRNSPYLFFSILIFFSFGQYYFNTFNAIRQCVVVYWFLSSLDLIIERKLVKFAVATFFMSLSFHTTALYLFVLYVLCQLDLSRKLKFGILCCIPFVTVFMTKLVEISNYAIYLDLEFSTQMTTLQYLILVLSVYYIIFPVRFSNPRTTRLFDMLNFVNTCVLGLLFFSQGTPLVMILTRLSYYTSPIYIIMVPQAISRFSSIRSRLGITMAVSIFLVLILYISLSVNGVQNNLIPYKTIIF